MMLELEKEHALSEEDQSLINDALEAVLATEKFHAAPQMSAFLRYVVEQAASGNQSRIKAFTVAVDALGKPDSFDPQNDPVVRVLAGRLRAALTAYNEQNTEAPIIITMSPGSYVPSFKRQRPDQQPASNIRHSSPEDKKNQTVAKSHTPSSDAELPGSGYATSSEKPSEKPYLEQGHALSAIAGHVSGNNSALNSALKSQNNAFFGGLLGSKPYKLFSVPKALLTAAIAGAAIWVVIAQDADRADDDTGMTTANSSVVATPVPITNRARPDRPAVFVSAINQGNTLENSLNAVISSALSESDEVLVFRILDEGSPLAFWPEDYILTLSALDLSDEKRVTMQMMEADSGLMVHSWTMALDEQADDQLTQAELDQLMNAAKEIVSQSGPLLVHHNARQTGDVADND